MSYYPIQLDKSRNFKYGMKATNLIEKKFKKPIMKIEGMTNPELLTMEELATIIWAGLVHEDKNLTPEKVMDLTDEHSSMFVVSREMWKAFNEAFKGDQPTEEETTKEKNE